MICSHHLWINLKLTQWQEFCRSMTGAIFPIVIDGSWGTCMLFCLWRKEKRDVISHYFSLLSSKILFLVLSKLRLKIDSVHQRPVCERTLTGTRTRGSLDDRPATTESNREVKPPLGLTLLDRGWLSSAEPGADEDHMLVTAAFKWNFPGDCCKRV